jgi:hypothetical protein
LRAATCLPVGRGLRFGSHPMDKTIKKAYLSVWRFINTVLAGLYQKERLAFYLSVSG